MTAMPPYNVYSVAMHFFPKLIVALVLLYCVIMIGHNSHVISDLAREMEHMRAEHTKKDENHTVFKEDNLDNAASAVLLGSEAVVNPHRKPREKSGMLDVRMFNMTQDITVYMHKIERIKSTRYPEKGLSLEPLDFSKLGWSNMCCKTGAGTSECAGNVKFVDDLQTGEKYVELRHARTYTMSCLLWYAVVSTE